MILTSLALMPGMLFASERNVLENPTFCSDATEQMPGWRVEVREHRLLKGQGSEGAAVLRLPLKNGRAYVVQTGLPLEAGRNCRFGAWVRTQGLQNKSAWVVLFNDGWQMSRAAALPEDTGGEWRKVEWSGNLMPGGPYGYAIHVERKMADGFIEICKPYVILNEDAKPGETGQSRLTNSGGSRGDHGAAFEKTLHGKRLIYHLDFNSLQRTKAAVVRELEYVASVGYNAVLWEIENAVRFDCCPEVAAPEAFTKKEFKDILVEANRLGLEPIPLMQTFGHGEYVLRHDRFRPLREVQERYDCYCPSKPETRMFLKELLHEYLEVFGPDVKRFHLGGDEAWFYQTCADCQARDPLELYVEHLSDVGAELRAKGIRPGCWHDMIVRFCHESGGKFSRFRDFTIWFWDYAYPKSWHPWGRADEPLHELVAAGCETFICGSAQSWKEDPFLVRYRVHRENLSACAALAKKENLSGFCVTSWTIHQGLKCLQRPLVDFAAKRYLNPADNEESDWIGAVRQSFGVLPVDALDDLSDWEIRYGMADGRGWNHYKDGSIQPRGLLPWRFDDPGKGMPKLAAELEDVSVKVERALDKLRESNGLTPLGRTMLEAGELKLIHQRLAARALRGEVVDTIPFDRTIRHYAIEYSPESAVRAARIAYAAIENKNDLANDGKSEALHNDKGDNSR